MNITDFPQHYAIISLNNGYQITTWMVLYAAFILLAADMQRLYPKMYDSSERRILLQEFYV